MYFYRCRNIWMKSVHFNLAEIVFMSMGILTHISSFEEISFHLYLFILDFLLFSNA